MSQAQGSVPSSAMPSVTAVFLASERKNTGPPARCSSHRYSNSRLLPLYVAQKVTYTYTVR